MVRILVALLLGVGLEAASSFASDEVLGNFQLRVRKPIHMSPAERFTIFVDGKLSLREAADLDQMDHAYCAIENMRLIEVRLKKGTRIKVTLKKLDFPNKDILRYSLVDAAGANEQIFCDFTKGLKFDPAKVQTHINRELGRWAKLTGDPGPSAEP